MLLEKEKLEIINYSKKMRRESLTDGTSGNISIFNRKENLIAISPTGMSYEDLKAEDIPIVNLSGEVQGSTHKPSSEMAFHLALYQKRDDINAIVHTHSHYACAIACLGLELPPVHYMIGFAGDKVPLAPYKTYGTKELSDAIIENIQNYNAILLENHGLIAMGNTIARTYACAEAIEFVSKTYVLAKSIGEPKILSKKEMEVVIEKFKDYGQK